MYGGIASGSMYSAYRFGFHVGHRTLSFSYDSYKMLWNTDQTFGFLNVGDFQCLESIPL